jgi:hypothetical protein
VSEQQMRDADDRAGRPAEGADRTVPGATGSDEWPTPSGDTGGATDSRSGEATGSRTGGSDAGASGSGVGASGSDAGGASGAGPLLPEGDVEAANRRWHDIQSTFVDDPRRAIAEADALVSQLVQQVTALFNAERSQFEALWDRGDKVSTEELRVGLQRYRSFFHRLLST